MRVGVDKSREDSLVRAIDLFDLAFVLLQPGMTKDLTLLSCNDDSSPSAEDSSVSDQSDVIEIGAATRGFGTEKRSELGDVG
jgi:hypothetical protein